MYVKHDTRTCLPTCTLYSANIWRLEVHSHDYQSAQRSKRWLSAHMRRGCSRRTWCGPTCTISLQQPHETPRRFFRHGSGIGWCNCIVMFDTPCSPWHSRSGLFELGDYWKSKDEHSSRRKFCRLTTLRENCSCFSKTEFWGPESDCIAHKNHNNFSAFFQVFLL